MRYSRQKEWKFLTGDVNWEDYGGSWYKKDARGVYWILIFENKEEWGDGTSGYYCGVARLDPWKVEPEEIESALSSSGWKFDPEGRPVEEPSILNDYDGTIVAEGGDDVEVALVHALVSYGIYSPMGSEDGKGYPDRVRAAARRLADELMADSAMERSALSTVINQIGSTAADFGRGDSLAGLRKTADAVLRGDKVEVSTADAIMLQCYNAADGITLGGVKETKLAEAGRLLRKEE